MKRVKVIKWNCLPSRPVGTLWTGAVVWLLCDRFHAPQWLIGGLVAVFVCTFVGGIAKSWYEDEVDVFLERKD